MIVLFSIAHKSTMVDLIVLDMVDCDVILHMDLLYACYASVDCRTRVVKCQFLNDVVLDCNKGQQYLRVIAFHTLRQ